MPSAAAEAFEAALNRGQPDTTSGAVSHFNTLLKAKMAGAPQGTTPRLGSPTGTKATDFESTRVYATHGAKYKVHEEHGRRTAVSNNDPAFEAQHLQDAPVVGPVKNKFQPFMEKFHPMAQKFGTFDTSKSYGPDHPLFNSSHPDHPNFGVYAYSLMDNAFNPNSTANRAGLAKKQGGLGDAERQEMIRSGKHLVDNNNEKLQVGRKATQMNRSHREAVRNIESGGLNGKDAAGTGRNLIRSYVREAGYVANMNRMFEASKDYVKTHGYDKWKGLSGEDLTKMAHEHGHISEFSQTRTPPGFMEEDLTKQGGHNGRAEADTTKKGDVVFTKTKWWKGAGGTGAHRSRHLGEELSRLKSLPVLHGVTDQKHIKEHNLAPYHDYVTPTQRAELDKHDEIFGTRHP